MFTLTLDAAARSQSKLKWIGNLTVKGAQGAQDVLFWARRLAFLIFFSLLPVCVEGGTGPVSVEPLLWAPEAKTAIADTQALSSFMTQEGKTPRLIDLGPGQIPPHLVLAANQLGYPIILQGKASPEVVKDRLGWVQEGNYYEGSLSIRSGGAKGLRLGLAFRSLPAEATLGFVGPDLEKGIWMPASKVLEDLAEKKAEAKQDANANLYWSPIMEGETMRIIVRVPVTTQPEKVEFSISQISHLYRVPTIPEVSGKSVQSSRPCILDARCHLSSAEASRSAINLVYTREGSTLSCSATLLNNRRRDGQPYVVTAEHCIRDQVSADNLIVYWFFSSRGCNQQMLSPDIRMTHHGARLLYQSVDMDFSFLRLNEMPPRGAVYAGWTTTRPRKGESLMGLHHPAGEPLKVSLGQLVGFMTCKSTITGSKDCDPSGIHGANFLQVQYHSGLTEQGRSGSGVFSNQGRYFRGNLYGSLQACGKSGGVTAYGRFDVAYSEGRLDRWLDPPIRKETSP